MIKIAGDNNNNDSAAWREVCSYQRKIKKVEKRKLIILGSVIIHSDLLDAKRCSPVLYSASKSDGDRLPDTINCREIRPNNLTFLFLCLLLNISLTFQSH